MYLKGFKVRGVGLKSNFKNLPDPLDEQQLLSAVELLRKENKEAKDLIITTHMRLALSLASKYAANFRQKSDDIIGVAMTALTEAVNNFASRSQDNNITPYISSTIQGRIADYLQSDHLVRITKYSSKDMEIFPEFMSLNSKDPITFEDETKEETKEIIDKMCLTVLEHNVLCFRVLGYTDAEIGRKIGKSRRRVGQVLETLKIKIGFVYHEKLDEKGKTFFGLELK